MYEYIERKEIRMAYEKLTRSYVNGNPYIADWRFDEMIEELPAADVAPVRHGRWITTSGEVFPGSSQFLCYSHKHDECGFQYVDMYDNEYDHCPKCGAKMDGGVDDACL